MRSPILSLRPRMARVRALTDIGHVLASDDQAPAACLELLRQMVDCKQCAVLVETTSHRQLFATSLSRGSPTHCADVCTTLRHYGSRPQANSLEPYRVTEIASAGPWAIAVPLVSADAILGILHMERDTVEYSVHELRLLALVASQFAGYARELQMLDQAERARVLAEETSQAKDRFLATLSHELRNPLNVIQGWLQILRSGPSDKAATRKALTVIENNVAVQAQLVDQLLDAARIATGKFHMDIQQLDILAVISTAVDGVRPSLASKGIELEYDVPSPQVWKIEGDPLRLQRAFGNLLVNAVKFTPTGGRVRVTVEQLGSQLSVAFRDNGIGIASEHLSKMFDSYWQADGATAEHRERSRPGPGDSATSSNSMAAKWLSRAMDRVKERL